MGNNSSGYSSKSERTKDRTNKVFFLLHRTWAVIVTDRWIKTRFSRTARSNDTTSDLDSQYSFCSCSQCHREDGLSSTSSEIFGSGSSMAPNSDERRKIDSFSWNDDAIAKEKQRPPIYNPEDYALSLRKWGRRPPANGPGLYSTVSSASEMDLSRSKTTTSRDYRNPMLSDNEMTLRQFGSVSELLCKLKSDLKLAYASFVQEFVADPLDGATLLLDVLRVIQLSQANNSGNTGTAGKIPPSVQRRALLDELSCLQCLLCCAVRYNEALRKITTSSAGLFTLSVCIMSNVTKSRVISLQLLTKICDLPGNGHSAVSEALSTLRLRFGEPVRFRFLVGMLTSTGGQGELLINGIRFLNAFLDSSESIQRRLYIQAELHQAGLDIDTIKKNVSINSSSADSIFKELDSWEKNYIDVEILKMRLENAERDTDTLRDKVLLLERKIQILQEEKGILISLEQCLKERCSELQDEVISLKSGSKFIKGTSNHSSLKRDRSTPAEDEGISSSERSLTPEEDLQRESSIYEVYSVQSETLPMAIKEVKTEKKGEEEETTIEEVMEELNNIINNAETEAYIKDREDKEKQKKSKEDRERIKMEEAQVKGKIIMNPELLIEDSVLDYESEIIPANLHPQPPRKARSLVHLYIPSEDYDCAKEMFFENDTAFTSEEGSDSLLSASKCLPKDGKTAPVPVEALNTNREILNTIMRARERSAQLKRRQRKSEVKNTMKRSESFRYPTMGHQIVEIKSPEKYVNSGPFSNRFTHFGESHEEVSQHRRSLQRSSSNVHGAGGQRLKSKSLDRIDDGLDAMVDIVVTDQKVEQQSPLRTKSDLGNVNSSTLSRSTSNVFANSKQDFKMNKFLSQQGMERNKMFLPVHNFEARGQGETHYYFPRVQERRSTTTTSFLIKRGHTNAGLYSGHVISKENVAKKTEYFASIGSKNSSGKVTDLPSGLY